MKSDLVNKTETETTYSPKDEEKKDKNENNE